MANPRLSGLFADRYLIERELGHGATAVVYLAHDNKQNRDVALKVLSRDLAHALGPQRFLREIQLTARLHHPHVLPIFDSGEWEGMLYYVMPFVRGESLREKIDRESQLPIEECVRIACEVADALAHAHAQGIVHRDVKPENIMLSEGHALLADFGIARTLDVHTGERLTSSGLIVGTSAYMSPEQASGEENIDARSDIYSLACVLYEMIAGVQAFTGPNTQSVIAQRFKHTPRPVSTYRPQVPEYIDGVLAKALTISPADRYKNVRKFSADLNGSTEPAIHDRRRSPLRRMIHGRQKAFGFGAAAIVLISAAAVIANPPVQWSLPFLRHAALDSAKFVVVPAPSPGHSEIGAKDLEAAARLSREIHGWSGVAVVDEEDVKDAIAASQIKQNGDAFNLAKRYSAGRLIRVNSAGDATLYDVATGEALNDLSGDDIARASDPAAASLFRLLRPKDTPSSANGGEGLTKSVPALRAYATAHRELEAHDLAAATRDFRLAASLDPQFAPAHLWTAQITEWMSPSDTLAWVAEAQTAGASAVRLAPRDRSLAIGLSALARGDFPAACAEYKRMVSADTTDFAAWLGLGECQRMDRMVLPSKASVSGFRFRSSFQSAGEAYVRAVRANAAAYDLIGYSRMREIKPMEPTKIRGGKDSTEMRYGAYPELTRDTIGYVPYPMPRFASMAAGASRRAALEKNLADLLGFAVGWVRAVPNSADGFEALATALEARGEIDRGAAGSISASQALANARTLTRNRTQRVRLTASEIRLRIKRGDYVGARTLSDSLLQSETVYDEEASDELIAAGMFTGRMGLAAKAAIATKVVPGVLEGVRIPPQVAETYAALFVHAAIGDCSPRSAQLQRDLDARMTSYLSEKERAALRPALLARVFSMSVPCTNGQSAIAIEKPDRLQRMQQQFARHDFARVRATFDSLDIARKFARPSDLSLDYTYQEAWLRAAIGDTAKAIRQLDQTLDALPSVSARGLNEAGGAAALPRAYILRAQLAAATHDAPVARRYANAVVQLWANADPELQSTTRSMSVLANRPK